MTKEMAESLGYKVIAASDFEVGLIKGEKGIRTWWNQFFNKKYSSIKDIPLDDPEIMRSIEINEEYER